jgi:NDP-sugar pyrophosphorylase family protein
MSAPANLRAAVLAGGLGTRLRPYTTVLPKPLVPVGERPILELIFDWLAQVGVTRAEVCIGHLGELIQTYFSQAQTIPAGLDVHWHWEHEPLGTAGALRALTSVTDTLLVVNGDVITDLDPAEMLAFHRREQAALTIATHETQLATEIGVIEHHGGRVTGYREKPVLSYDASMGVYLYEPRALAALPAGPCQFPDLVLELLERGERVAAFQTQAAWHHVGTLAQHVDASQAMLAAPKRPDTPVQGPWPDVS